MSTRSRTSIFESFALSHIQTWSNEKARGILPIVFSLASAENKSYLTGCKQATRSLKAHTPASCPCFSHLCRQNLYLLLLWALSCFPISFFWGFCVCLGALRVCMTYLHADDPRPRGHQVSWGWSYTQHLVWVLGPELWSSTTVTNIFHHQVTSQAWSLNSWREMNASFFIFFT